MLYYIGDGARFPGVPTRDLTKDEVESLDPALVEVMLAHKLYTRTRSHHAKAESAPESDAPAPAKDTKP